MSTFDMIMMFIPMISFIGLMLAIKTGKLASIYMFAVVTIATVILGIISLSVMHPLASDMSSLTVVVSNVLVITYIGAMIYGAWGVRSGNFERVTAAFMFVLLVSLTSAVIG